MDGEWYCKIGGQEMGPLMSRQIRDMMESGSLLPTDRVRRGATGRWMPAGQLPALLSQEARDTPSPGPQKPAPVVRRPVNLPPASPALADIVVDTSVTQPLSDLSTMYSRRRHQQQQRLIGLLAVIGVGVVLALLILVFGRSAGPSTPPEPSVQPDRASLPTPPPSPRTATKESAKPAPAPANATGSKDDRAPKPAIKELDEPIRPPTGNPESDFGIKVDEAVPEATPSPPPK